MLSWDINNNHNDEEKYLFCYYNVCIFLCRIQDFFFKNYSAGTHPLCLSHHDHKISHKIPYNENGIYIIIL